MATQTLKRCPKSTCIANVGFQQMLFTGPGNQCPHCGSKLELIAPPRSRSANKSGGKSVGGKTVSRASSSPTLGNKKKRRKVAQKKMQFKTWDLSLKPEARKSV